MLGIFGQSRHHQQMANYPALRTNFAALVVGTLLGGLVIWGYTWGKWSPHYHEDDIFFRGMVGDREVLGIYYHEFQGLGFMDSGRWKVVLRGVDQQDVLLYQNRPVFQEPIPHQPEVKILDGNRVSIDDGEVKLSVTADLFEVKFGEAGRSAHNEESPTDGPHGR